MRFFSSVPCAGALKTPRVSRCFAFAIILVGVLATATAGSINIGQTPVLIATLPTNSTYQVEFSTNGTVWNFNGVLIAGTGNSASVRLDGFPTNGSYRLSAIGVSNIVTPVISNSLYVGASFPGASEVRIEAVNPLGMTNWTNQAFAFSNLQSAFVTPLRTPLGSNAFFRALQPVTPLLLAALSSYPAEPNSTYSGYGNVADDMPQLYKDGFIAALCPAVYHRGGTNAAAAGECYELVGPQGKTTVIVADIEQFPTPGTCDGSRLYLDIGTPAFTNLFKNGEGYGVAAYRVVPAPVVGNIKMVCVNNSGGYYVELRPYNHRAGVIKMEVQGAGGSWTELPRTDYNSFIYSSGTPLAFPINTRITSRFGEVVTFPVINSMASDDRFTANAQFTMFPDQGPSPVWILPPVYTDALTNGLGGDWATGGVGNPSYSGDVYQGSYSLQISNLAGFNSVTFYSPVKFPRQTDAYLEFAIRSESASINGLKIQFVGSDATGVSAQSVAVSLPTIDGNWRAFRIPLQPALTPLQITQFRLMNSTAGTLPTINLDAIAFRW